MSTRRRIRVCEVITRLDVGGAQETIADVVRFIDSDRVEVVVVGGEQDADASVLRRLRDAGARPVLLSPFRRSVGLHDAVTLVALVRRLRSERPDVVHTHSSKAGVLGRVAARLARVPAVVHTVHGWSFHAGQPAFTHRACVVLERLLARWTDVLVVVAQTDQRAGEAQRIRPKRGYRVIRSGIDCERFTGTTSRRTAARAALGLPNDVPVVGTVTRLSEQKDPLAFVRVVARVVADNPSTRAVVVGDGPLARHARDEARRLDVDDRIEFVGTRTDVADVLPAFDVFLLTSRWEGLPRVLVEAMAAGVPVVATDVNGVSEIIEDGATGRLAPPGDIDALVRATAATLTDITTAHEMASAARVSLVPFDARTMAADHERLYRELAPPRPVRVVHVITGLEAGGAENMLANLVAACDPAGFASHVISLTDLGPVADRIRSAGVPVEALGMSRGRPDAARAFRLARRLRALRPDVVQTWLYHADVVGGIAARIARVPVVAWHIDTAVPNAITKPATRRVVKAAAKLSRIVPTSIVMCAPAAVEPHVALGYPRSRMRIITNGIDVERFRPDCEARRDVRAEFGISPGAPVVCLVARFEPQKGFETFVHATAVVAKHVQDLQVLMCGTGVTRENETLVGWCRSWGMLERSHLLGERTDLPRIFAATDVVASASVMEGFPLVVGEAMASGVPAVATAVGDTAVLVGDAGRLVPPNDPSALAHGILEILELPRERRACLGQAAAERVRRSFALDRTVREFERFYAELASGVAVIDK